MKQSTFGITYLSIAPILSITLSILLVLFHYEETTTTNDPSNSLCRIFCDSEILRVIQQSNVYPNSSKTFVDMPMKYDPDVVERNYKQLGSNPTVDQLKKFVEENFDEVGSDVIQWIPDDMVDNPPFLSQINDTALQQWGKEVNQLWKLLGRKFTDDVYKNPLRHSLIPTVNNMMVVAGGRFREIYYWDSLWILKGLLTCNMYSTSKKLIENILGLVKDFGFVPNGNRRYYLNRSQPPVLTLMVELYYNATSDIQFVRDAISLLDREYEYWMQKDKKAIVINETYVLNRYYTQTTIPRPESYREDVITASNRLPNETSILYSQLAAGAESGWDYSSRWFEDGERIETIEIMNIIPVDLNIIMCKNEKTLGRLHKLLGETSKSEYYEKANLNRRKAIEAVLWNAELNQWSDYNLGDNVYGDRSKGYGSKSNRTGILSNYLPLWCGDEINGDGCYESNDKNVSSIIESFATSGLIGDAGLATTSQMYSRSEQQWDFPNAWPNLQSMIIEGLEKVSVSNRYGDDGRKRGKQLAFHLAQQWILTNFIAFNQTGYMYEKYDSQHIGHGGGGGEYHVQIGFGWTNGVALSLLKQYGDRLQSSVNQTLSQLVKS